MRRQSSIDRPSELQGTTVARMSVTVGPRV
jgi:hypothetical protein